MYPNLCLKIISFWENRQKIGRTDRTIDPQVYYSPKSSQALPRLIQLILEGFIMAIALITGANKGIGLETARQLAATGVHVLIGVRDAAKGQAAVESLKAEGLNVEPIEIDVTQEASVKAAVQQVMQRHGKLDILVNNAGINPEFPQGIFTIEQLSLEMLTQIYQTNFFGAFLATREFLPLLRQSSAGRIVNVSSTLGSLTEQSNAESPYSAFTIIGYNSSKTALNALTVQMGKLLADTNIKINSACPGWVKTDLGGDSAPRNVVEGAGIIIKLATLPDDGPNGGFFDENGVIPW
jgi:NAD(P)-dependent dehydrogenase (short-subunit alcohol dehydrogenase family)